MIAWLKAEEETDIVNGNTLYQLDKLKSKYEVREICEDGYIVLNWDKEKFWLEFAIMSFYWSSDDEIAVSCIFHGSGPSGVLRECRHTWWGEDGYIFYPDGKIISAAFKVLSEFYDEMTD